LISRTVADASAMERILPAANSIGPWCAPPELTDKLTTGKYRVREGHLPRFGLKVSRADVAGIMIKTALNPASGGKVYGVRD
jgi:hypothetical protein